MENPNKPMALSTIDRRNSSYVKSIKVSSQIIKLKQVTHENSEKEDEVKKFKNHISTSKISFIGYDVKNNYHKISEDWVEMNFKEQSPDVYKRIMTLGAKKYKIELVGPKILCPQEDNLSCLPCSLASAFVYLKMEEFAERA